MADVNIFLLVNLIMHSFPDTRGAWDGGAEARSHSGNRILCILALKYDIEWHQIY